MLVNILSLIAEPQTLSAALQLLSHFPYTRYENGVAVAKEVNLPRLLAEAEACVVKAQQQLSMDASLGHNPHRIAAIRLYTMNTMYHVVNSSLRSTTRSPESLQPLLPFLKLLITALRRLPEKLHFKGTVFRGEKGCHPQFHTKFKTGNYITYYGFTSTTTEKAVLRNPAFCGTTGVRTIIQIDGVFECAYRIATLSDYQGENEVLLEPCVQFRVKQATDCNEGPWAHVAADTAGLHSVVVQQVQPAYLLEPK